MMAEQWPFDPALKAWGAVYKPAVVQPGQPYWKIVIANGPRDIGGNISLFVDVWGEDGTRQVNIPVLFYWEDGKKNDRKFTEPKPGDGFAVDLPMYASRNAYGVRVDDGLPSDAMEGFGLGEWVPHHGFLVVFQRTIAESIPVDPQPPTMPIPSTAREAFEMARKYMDIGMGML